MSLGEVWSLYSGQMFQDLVQHLYITGIALFAGAIVAVPVGILLTRAPRVASPILAVASILQTIPSLAFFALVLPFLGIGLLPALLVLFLYSLLPILRNTYVGLRTVDPSLVDVAKGLGMTNVEQLLWVELPLTASIIVAGIRLAAIYLVSWATVAALIGAGGLGDLIFTGIDNINSGLILLGAIPTALLALVAGLLFGQVQRWVTPRGLRREVGAR